MVTPDYYYPDWGGLVDFFCNPGLKNCWNGLPGIEPTTLDLSSQSGAYDLSAMATPNNCEKWAKACFLPEELVKSFGNQMYAVAMKEYLIHPKTIIINSLNLNLTKCLSVQLYSNRWSTVLQKWLLLWWIYMKTDPQCPYELDTQYISMIDFLDGLLKAQNWKILLSKSA